MLQSELYIALYVVAAATLFSTIYISFAKYFQLKFPTPQLLNFTTACESSYSRRTIIYTQARFLEYCATAARCVLSAHSALTRPWDIKDSPAPKARPLPCNSISRQLSLVVPKNFHLYTHLYGEKKVLSYIYNTHRQVHAHTLSLRVIALHLGWDFYIT